jgi:hypothetical protein
MTIVRWRLEHPEFCDATKVGKEIADDRMERSLYERGVGYTVDAVKIFNDGGKPLVVPYQQHVPPDVSAAKHWLHNRRPDRWRERTDNNLTIDPDSPFERMLARIDGESRTIPEANKLNNKP